MSKLQIYVATAMTGRDKKELIDEAKKDLTIFAKYDIKAYSPVLEENIPYTKGKLKNWKAILVPKWVLDKRAMRQSFAIVDRTADLKSEGVQHEVGFMRYCLWRPVIRVSPKHSNGYFSVANLEDDFIVSNVEEAAKLLKHKWGTWYKRFVWQLRIINRCLLRFLWDHFTGVWL